MKHVRTALIVIVALVFGYMLLGELLLPANVPRNGYLCERLPGDNWVRVLEDGTREPFGVPGRTDGDITLETTLPKTLDRDVTALWFRGMDMEIERERAEAPVVLVVSEDAEKLREAKEALGGRYRCVLVRGEAQAEKYLENHKTAFVLRG